MRFATLSLALLLNLTPALVWAAAPNSGNAGNSADVSTKLQAAVQDSQKQLGELEPWQKRLFTEEVMPQYPRFIRDYRASGVGLVIDVDVESIKNYLRFYGPKFGKTKVLLALKTDAGCPKCVDSAGAVRTLLLSRMERRGLTPVWMPDAELKLEGKALEERMVQYATDHKLSAALAMSLGRAQAEDAAHADEVHYNVRAMFWVKDVSKHEGELEILENDNLEKTAGRLLTDFFTDLGTKLDRAQVSTSNEKFFIEVTGIQGFAQYQDVKTKILGLEKDGIPVEERKVSRGKVLFAVFGDKSIEAIKRALAALELDKVKTQVRAAGEPAGN